MTPTFAPDQAALFWAQLATFSERAFDMLDLPKGGSPHGHSAWAKRPGAPVPAPEGAIVHWTASDSATSAVRWFCDPASQVSAHVVVADRKLPWADGLMEDLPLVQALPATVVQCRRPDHTAWHARSLDGSYYSIENQNVGLLQGRDNALSWLAGNRLVPYRSDKPAVFVFAKPYEPYTPAQLQANVDILCWLRALYPGALRRACVLGHEHVQSGQMKPHPDEKFDPGPLYPWPAIRAAVFAEAPSGRTLPPLPAGTDAALGWRADIARVALLAWAQTNPGHRAPRRTPIADMAPPEAFAAFYNVAVHGQNLAVDPLFWRAALACLGFDAWLDAPDDAVAISLLGLQRLGGLMQDGIFGPKSAQALSTRLRLRLG